jgi:hypothetical protein
MTLTLTTTTTTSITDQPSVFLTVGDVAQLAALLEQQLGKKGLFDYNSILNSTVGALKLALEDKIIRNSGDDESAKRRKTSGTKIASPLPLPLSSLVTRNR